LQHPQIAEFAWLHYGFGKIRYNFLQFPEKAKRFYDGTVRKGVSL
jgi:hypothetical protein